MSRLEHKFYESPRLDVIENFVEGVLCSSMVDNTFEGWGEENLWS